VSQQGAGGKAGPTGRTKNKEREKSPLPPGGSQSRGTAKACVRVGGGVCFGLWFGRGGGGGGGGSGGGLEGVAQMVLLWSCFCIVGLGGVWGALLGMVVVRAQEVDCKISLVVRRCVPKGCFVGGKIGVSIQWVGVWGD